MNIARKADACTSLVALAAMVAVAAVIGRTRLGREMRALSDDRTLARVARISENKALTLTWGLVGALAAIAGICYGIKSELRRPWLSSGGGLGARRRGLRAG